MTEITPISKLRKANMRDDEHKKGMNIFFVSTSLLIVIAGVILTSFAQHGIDMAVKNSNGHEFYSFLNCLSFSLVITGLFGVILFFKSERITKRSFKTILVFELIICVIFALILSAIGIIAYHNHVPANEMLLMFFVIFYYVLIVVLIIELITITYLMACHFGKTSGK